MILSFIMSETVYGTQTGRLLISCSLFYCLQLEAGGYFSFDNFNILSIWSYWYCANKWCASFTLFQNK